MTVVTCETIDNVVEQLKSHQRRWRKSCTYTPFQQWWCHSNHRQVICNPTRSSTSSDSSATSLLFGFGFPTGSWTSLLSFCTWRSRCNGSFTSKYARLPNWVLWDWRWWQFIRFLDDVNLRFQHHHGSILGSISISYSSSSSSGAMPIEFGMTVGNPIDFWRRVFHHVHARDVTRWFISVFTPSTEDVDGESWVSAFLKSSPSQSIPTSSWPKSLELGSWNSDIFDTIWWMQRETLKLVSCSRPSVESLEVNNLKEKQAVEADYSIAAHVTVPVCLQWKGHFDLIVRGQKYTHHRTQ